MSWAGKYDVNYQDWKQNSISGTGNIADDIEMQLRNVICKNDSNSNSDRKSFKDLNTFSWFYITKI